MAKTFVPLAHTTLSESANPVVFENIPQNYTDLVIYMSARSFISGSNDGLAIRINGDTGSNYSNVYFGLAGTSGVSSKWQDDTFIRMWAYATSALASPANASGNTIIRIFNYSNTNVFKTTMLSGNVTEAGIARVVSTWRSTSAVTSLSFIGYNHDFTPSSSWTIYGVGDQ